MQMYVYKYVQCGRGLEAHSNYTDTHNDFIHRNQYYYIHVPDYLYMNRAQIAHKLSFLRSLLGFIFSFNVDEPPLYLFTHTKMYKHLHIHCIKKGQHQ